MIFSLRHVVACLVLVMALDASAGELTVIVSARSPTPMLDRNQVAAIFLGQTPTFPDGTIVTAIDQPLGNVTRDEFYTRVAAKSPALLKAYWSKLLFTGRGQPPREVAGNAAIKKLVADTPGLIGYIDSSALDASVRTVLVVH
ncbi:MAG: phosphate ABC transporter substrate-binding protein [Pseudomonadota bacterium]|nr:phosphate ABC transporter substrate-binding protein [Pseudomonadota bacterium]